MAIVKIFHKYRGLNDFTLHTIIAIARDLLPKIVTQQPRYKVAELPTERTIRYYISKSLMDKPVGREGTSALYGYRHLLQILAIKYLQSQYIPLQKIKSILQGRSNRELEQLLPESPTSSLADFHYLDPSKTFRSHPVSPHRPYDESPSHSSHPSHPGERDTPPPSESESDRWHHLLIAPGMELHLRDDIRTPRNPAELEHWREEFLLTLERLRLKGQASE